MRSLRGFQDRQPALGARVYVDESAVVIGAVELDDDVSIWPGAVLRGDVARISIGARSNVQDGTVIHVNAPDARAPAGMPALIGEGVTIGHAAVVHACTIGNYALIGMHATVLDGARIEAYGFVGAGSLIAPGKVVGQGELWLGNPARRARMLSDLEIEHLRESARHYVDLKEMYLAER